MLRCNNLATSSTLCLPRRFNDGNPVLIFVKCQPKNFLVVFWLPDRINMSYILNILRVFVQVHR